MQFFIQQDCPGVQPKRGIDSSSLSHASICDWVCSGYIDSSRCHIGGRIGHRRRPRTLPTWIPACVELSYFLFLPLFSILILLLHALVPTIITNIFFRSISFSFSFIFSFLPYLTCGYLQSLAIWLIKFICFWKVCLQRVICTKLCRISCVYKFTMMLLVQIIYKSSIRKIMLTNLHYNFTCKLCWHYCHVNS